jgi:hypothetical protein
VRSRTTRQFRELPKALPESVQRQARDAYQLFREDPFHPGLQFKSVSPRNPKVWSVRIGIHYRAIGIRDADAILLWVWIGSHAAYDRELQRS